MGSINPQEKQRKYNNNITQHDICSEKTDGIVHISCIPCGFLEQNSQVSDFKNSAKKTAMEYICPTCDFITYKKYNYDQHLLTKKHIFNFENIVKHKKQFHCKDCDIFFSKNIDLIRHMNTKKHLKNIGSIKINKVFTCKKCDKEFNKQSLLNRHLSSKLHLKQIDDKESFINEGHIEENKTEDGDKYVDIVNKLLYIC